MAVGRTDSTYKTFLTPNNIGISTFGCCPKMDVLSKAEKIFIKMVDRTAAKLDLNEDQKVKLVQLKVNIRKNFEEGTVESKKSLSKIKEEGRRENPDIKKMTNLLQTALQDETQKINRAFDLMLEFRDNLTEAQQNKLNRMISAWVAEWK